MDWVLTTLFSCIAFIKNSTAVAWQEMGGSKQKRSLIIIYGLFVTSRVKATSYEDIDSLGFFCFCFYYFINFFKNLKLLPASKDIMSQQSCYTLKKKKKIKTTFTKFRTLFNIHCVSKVNILALVCTNMQRNPWLVDIGVLVEILDSLSRLVSTASIESFLSYCSLCNVTSLSNKAVTTCSLVYTFCVVSYFNTALRLPLIEISDSGTLSKCV